MIITTTTDTIEGKRIVRYLGVVTGEAVIGSNMFEDLFRELKGIVGGRANRFEQRLSQTRAMAMKLLRDNAQEVGANAVVGIDLDYEVFSAGAMMLMVIANGTAVFVEDEEKKS